MKRRSLKSVEAAIDDIVCGTAKPEAHVAMAQYGLDVLPALSDRLANDWPIDIVERLEQIFKAVLHSELQQIVSGDIARQIALAQQRIGLLFKYKSYAIKASSPLGYSIFVQNNSEGFSFQQHLSHKTEVFHILEVHPHGYVFMCSYDDWAQHYEKDSFAAWLSGQPDDRYDPYCFKPEPGDVFVIDQLKTVHTAIGCILEEFATVSTDMVDRLHDQNAGKPIPAYFNRHYAKDRLRSLSVPDVTRNIDMHSRQHQIEEVVPKRIPGGYKVSLARTASMLASRYIIDPLKSSELQWADRDAASIYILAGRGQVLLGEKAEVDRLTPPAIPVDTGDLLLISPCMYYGFVNEGEQALKLSEHRIPPEVALCV